MTEEESTPLIDQARETAERLEAANKKSEELAKRLEAIEQRNILGGNTRQAAVAPELTEDEKYKIRAKERYAGTGLDPTRGL